MKKTTLSNVTLNPISSCWVFVAKFTSKLYHLLHVAPQRDIHDSFCTVCILEATAIVSLYLFDSWNRHLPELVIFCWIPSSLGTHQTGLYCDKINCRSKIVRLEDGLLCIFCSFINVVYPVPEGFPISNSVAVTFYQYLPYPLSFSLSKTNHQSCSAIMSLFQEFAIL